MTDYAPEQIVRYSHVGANEQRLLYIRQVQPTAIPEGVGRLDLVVTDLDTMVPVRTFTLHGTVNPHRYFNTDVGGVPLSYDLGEVFAANIPTNVIDELVVPRTDALRESVRTHRMLVSVADELFPR